jgi:DNA-binding MarR family transcriptional regulator
MATSDCTCNLIRAMARHVTRVYDDEMRPSGLKLTQYAVLSRLRRLGSTNLGSLARECDLDVTSMSRAIRPLIDRGLVSLGDGPDARTNAYTLTQTGESAYQCAHEQWERAQDSVAELISPELVRELQAVTAALQERSS